MLLSEFMKSNNIKVSEAARQLGVSSMTIYRWLDGGRRPSLKFIYLIWFWSGARITGDDWLLQYRDQNKIDSSRVSKKLKALKGRK